MQNNIAAKAAGGQPLDDSPWEPTEMTMRTTRRQDRLAVLLVGAVALTSCTHLGPKTVAVDRFDYSTAIADSWKQQTLLNIVKLRYMDLPVFMDVASVVSGYSLQTGVSVNGTLASGPASAGNSFAS